MALRLFRRSADTEDHPQHVQEIQLTRRKLRRRIGGSLVPVKNAASARNALPNKVWITHGGNSKTLLRATFDMRSAVGKAYQVRVEELTAHLGGAEVVTAPQRTLIDHAARLRLLALLAWDEISRGGAFRAGEPTAAFDAYRRVSADERDVLRTLGLERRAKPVPDLDSYLRAKAKRLPRLLSPEE